MKVETTQIDGVRIIEPDVFYDARGYFYESYNVERFRAAGITHVFVQDNESQSMKGVVRGLHWQTGVHAQTKLLRVVRGAVLDVAVDIRKGSPTFGQHVAVELSATNKRQLLVPKGFAHGFIVLEDDTILNYKCDNVYCRESERGLRFDDPQLGIQWPDLGVSLVLSEKDQHHPTLDQIEPWEEA